MHNLLFWMALATLFLLAGLFVLPPIWIAAGTNNTKLPQRLLYSCSICLFLGLISLYLYLRFGAATEMPSYLQQEHRQLRADTAKIRPLYARLQRELVKNKLDLALDLENLDLILHFALLHSQLQQGLLQPEVVELLQVVLKAVPQQVSALNLLAVNEYKQQRFAQAINYWERILQQFPAEMSNSDIAIVLQDKIIAARAKQMQFESSQTNNKNF